MALTAPLLDGLPVTFARPSSVSIMVPFVRTFIRTKCLFAAFSLTYLILVFLYFPSIRRFATSAVTICVMLPPPFTLLCLLTSLPTLGKVGSLPNSDNLFFLYGQYLPPLGFKPFLLAVHFVILFNNASRILV